MGKIVVDNTIFYIDEIKNTCEGKNYNNVCYENSKKLKTRHLHISFRKGISVEQIIENELIEYDSLSVDVMIHSVNFFISVLKKYSNKIDILFCNMDEYIMIKEYIDSKTIVVITNNSKPVTVLAFNKIYMAEVDYICNVVSTTGAGDSFIGGFLGSYLQERNLEESIKSGIIISQKSILNIRTFNE